MVTSPFRREQLHPDPGGEIFRGITLSSVDVERTIRVKTGTWSGSPTGYSYQWKLCDSAGNNCANIGGEIFSGITLSGAYVGSTLRVTVTATNTAARRAPPRLPRQSWPARP